MKNYFEIEEGKEVNSIKELYLTYTTIMKDIIDSDTYDDMMVRVVKDILEKDIIVNDIKNLKRKKRLFLAPIIYNWAKREWKHNTRLPQNTYYPNTHSIFKKVEKDFYEIFLNRFKEAFHTDVFEKVEYDYKTKDLYLKIQNNQNTYNIIMYEGDPVMFWRYIFGRMTVKYKKKTNELKICYIENIVWSSKYSKFTPQYFRLELFKAIKKIKNEIHEKTSKEPKVICNAKYKNLLNKAIKLGYLE